MLGRLCHKAVGLVGPPTVVCREAAAAGPLSTASEVPAGQLPPARPLRDKQALATAPEVGAAVEAVLRQATGALVPEGLSSSRSSDVAQDPPPSAPMILTEEQLDRIAEKAADKAVAKITNQVYQQIGRSVVTKMTWLLGACVVGIGIWLKSEGKLP